MFRIENKITYTFYSFRVVGVILITARNVTIALHSAPESSKAYESGSKIISIIKESENSARLLTNDKKLVS